jgi:hypothetical protein
MAIAPININFNGGVTWDKIVPILGIRTENKALKLEIF